METTDVDDHLAHCGLSHWRKSSPLNTTKEGRGGKYPSWLETHLLGLGRPNNYERGLEFFQDITTTHHRFVSAASSYCPSRNPVVNVTSSCCRMTTSFNSHHPNFQFVSRVKEDLIGDGHKIPRCRDNNSNLGIVSSPSSLFEENYNDGEEEGPKCLLYDCDVAELDMETYKPSHIAHLFSGPRDCHPHTTSCCCHHNSYSPPCWHGGGTESATKCPEMCRLGIDCRLSPNNSLLTESDTVVADYAQLCSNCRCGAAKQGFFDPQSVPLPPSPGGDVNISSSYLNRAPVLHRHNLNKAGRKSRMKMKKRNKRLYKADVPLLGRHDKCLNQYNNKLGTGSRLSNTAPKLPNCNLSVPKFFSNDEDHQNYYQRILTKKQISAATAVGTTSSLSSSSVDSLDQLINQTTRNFQQKIPKNLYQLTYDNSEGNSSSSLFSSSNSILGASLLSGILISNSSPVSTTFSMQSSQISIGTTHTTNTIDKSTRHGAPSTRILLSSSQSSFIKPLFYHHYINANDDTQSMSRSLPLTTSHCCPSNSWIQDTGFGRFVGDTRGMIGKSRISLSESNRDPCFASWHTQRKKGTFLLPKDSTFLVLSAASKNSYSCCQTAVPLLTCAGVRKSNHHFTSPSVYRENHSYVSNEGAQKLFSSLPCCTMTRGGEELLQNNNFPPCNEHDDKFSYSAMDDSRHKRLHKLDSRASIFVSNDRMMKSTSSSHRNHSIHREIPRANQKPMARHYWAKEVRPDDDCSCCSVRTEETKGSNQEIINWLNSGSGIDNENLLQDSQITEGDEGKMNSFLEESLVGTVDKDGGMETMRSGTSYIEEDPPRLLTQSSTSPPPSSAATGRFIVKNLGIQGILDLFERKFFREIISVIRFTLRMLPPTLTSFMGESIDSESDEDDYISAKRFDDPSINFKPLCKLHVDANPGTFLKTLNFVLLKYQLYKSQSAFVEGSSRDGRVHHYSELNEDWLQKVFSTDDRDEETCCRICRLKRILIEGKRLLYTAATRKANFKRGEHLLNQESDSSSLHTSLLFPSSSLFTLLASLQMIALFEIPDKMMDKRSFKDSIPSSQQASIQQGVSVDVDDRNSNSSTKAHWVASDIMSTNLNVTNIISAPPLNLSMMLNKSSKDELALREQTKWQCRTPNDQNLVPPISKSPPNFPIPSLFGMSDQSRNLMTSKESESIAAIPHQQCTSPTTLPDLSFLRSKWCKMKEVERLNTNNNIKIKSKIEFNPILDSDFLSNHPTTGSDRISVCPSKNNENLYLFSKDAEINRISALNEGQQIGDGDDDLAVSDETKYKVKEDPCAADLLYEQQPFQSKKNVWNFRRKKNQGITDSSEAQETAEMARNDEENQYLVHEQDFLYNYEEKKEAEENLIDLEFRDKDLPLTRKMELISPIPPAEMVDQVDEGSNLNLEQSGKEFTVGPALILEEERGEEDSIVENISPNCVDNSLEQEFFNELKVCISKLKQHFRLDLEQGEQQSPQHHQSNWDHLNSITSKIIGRISQILTNSPLDLKQNFVVRCDNRMTAELSELLIDHVCPLIKKITISIGFKSNEEINEQHHSPSNLEIWNFIKRSCCCNPSSSTLNNDKKKSLEGKMFVDLCVAIESNYYKNIGLTIPGNSENFEHVDKFIQAFYCGLLNLHLLDNWLEHLKVNNSDGHPLRVSLSLSNDRLNGFYEILKLIPFKIFLPSILREQSKQPSIIINEPDSPQEEFIINNGPRPSKCNLNLDGHCLGLTGSIGKKAVKLEDQQSKVQPSFIPVLKDIWTDNATGRRSLLFAPPGKLCFSDLAMNGRVKTREFSKFRKENMDDFPRVRSEPVTPVYETSGKFSSRVQTYQQLHGLFIKAAYLKNQQKCCRNKVSNKSSGAFHMGNTLPISNIKKATRNKSSSNHNCKNDVNVKLFNEGGGNNPPKLSKTYRKLAIAAGIKRFSTYRRRNICDLFPVLDHSTEISPTDEPVVSYFQDNSENFEPANERNGLTSPPSLFMPQFTNNTGESSQFSQVIGRTDHRTSHLETSKIRAGLRQFMRINGLLVLEDRRIEKPNFTNTRGYATTTKPLKNYENSRSTTNEKGSSSESGIGSSVVC